MIYTSYFANLRKLPNNVIPVAICAKVPDWYTGARYTDLAPRYDLLMKWKVDHNNDDYTNCFRATTLEPLNLQWTLDKLQMMIPEEVKMQMDSPVWRNHNWHIALICYEKSEDFCHRHLVAEWFRQNGYECEEWKPEK